MAEIRENQYDIVGISGIAPNLLKVEKDVPTGAPAPARGNDCSRRPRGEHPPVWNSESMRTSSCRRRSAMVPPIPRRGPDRPIVIRGSKPTSGTRDLGALREAISRLSQWPRSFLPSVVRWGAISARLQPCLVAREVRFLLRDRRRAVRNMCKLESHHGDETFFVMDRNFLLHRKRSSPLARN